mmetsp:Transcript_9440/g.16749  ORF Transcript_9440/g.16749 Transcript_9440/m.16749 type:complete len:175 (-) Transcript_9440:203-727(-)
MKKAPPAWQRKQNEVKKKVKAVVAASNKASQSKLANYRIPTEAQRKKIPLPPHPPTIVATKKMKHHWSLEDFNKSRRATAAKQTRQDSNGGWQPIVPWDYSSKQFTTIPKCKSSARVGEWKSWHLANDFARHAEYVLCSCGEWVLHHAVSGKEAQGHQNSLIHKAFVKAKYGRC